MAVLKPSIVYGTAWKGERTTQLVISAFLQGFRAIDTACQPKHYREELVGEALDVLHHKHGLQREEYFLQTKFTPLDGHDRTLPLPYDPHTPVPTQIGASLAASLQNLRASYLDAYLLHGPLPTLPATLAAWRALAAAQDARAVRAIGVCNVYDVALLDALARVRPVQIVQNRWYEGNRWDRAVCRYCRDNGIVYQAFWALTGSPSLLGHPAVRAVAHKLDVTPAQVVFKFAQLHGITPLTGTRSELHMQQDLAAERLALDGVQSEIDAIARFVWGDGDGD